MMYNDDSRIGQTTLTSSKKMTNFCIHNIAVTLYYFSGTGKDEIEYTATEEMQNQTTSTMHIMARIDVILSVGENAK